jgi:hypothetical protein
MDMSIYNHISYIWAAQLAHPLLFVRNKTHCSQSCQVHLPCLPQASHVCEIRHTYAVRVLQGGVAILYIYAIHSLSCLNTPPCEINHTYMCSVYLSEREVYSFNTGYVPLNYSGNPGVHVSDRGGNDRSPH